jgi:hypothetical protein
MSTRTLATDEDTSLNIWISYSQEDQDFVDQLKLELVKAGYTVRTPDDIVSPGDSLIERIPEAIVESDVVLAVISKASGTSEWIKEELAFALSEQLRRNRPIVMPILIERNAPIPTLLKDRMYADFSKGRNFQHSVSQLLSYLASLAHRKAEVSTPTKGHVNIELAERKSELTEKFLLSQAEALKFEVAKAEMESRIRQRSILIYFTMMVSTVFLAVVLATAFNVLPFESPRAARFVSILKDVFPALIGLIIGYFFGSVSSSLGRTPEKHDADRSAGLNK